MAFSYSDNNFTVIGNLCFVHILLDGTQTTYDIPPAIVDRMLFNEVGYIYPYFSQIESRSLVILPDIGFASIKDYKINCSDKGKGYLSFYFPIDSNK